MLSCTPGYNSGALLYSRVQLRVLSFVTSFIFCYNSGCQCGSIDSWSRASSRRFARWMGGFASLHYICVSAVSPLLPSHHCSSASESQECEQAGHSSFSAVLQIDSPSASSGRSRQLHQRLVQSVESFVSDWRATTPIA